MQGFYVSWDTIHIILLCCKVANLHVQHIIVHVSHKNYMHTHCTYMHIMYVVHQSKDLTVGRVAEALIVNKAARKLSYSIYMYMYMYT